ncbi:hypothetical protein B9G69_001625 [Bdellovibrio sp. SKB1291214]|uniref:hypothetical protein n=1 Tax=Bdellovibrio sp. SKB1291214 TaxID=1732569 RepID=UPI000B51958E|nr:hypothetical protein [Bdellovibrio sp. SKB1291214]UYL09273.1 hypothetical protein B9G69_001625 [Bdellovibrio sp. SKB1291214]
MNSELGVFALRQIVSSMVVLGPLVVITGAFSYVFNQNRRAVVIYIVVGVVLTAIGAVNLYGEFNGRKEQEVTKEKE